MSVGLDEAMPRRAACTVGGARGPGGGQPTPTTGKIVMCVTEKCPGYLFARPADAASRGEHGGRISSKHLDAWALLAEGRMVRSFRRLGV